MTALIILLTGADQLRLTGALVTRSLPSPSRDPAKISPSALTFFAFTTIIGWYYFQVKINIRYLFSEKSRCPALSRARSGGTIVLGTLGKVDLVWNMSDMFSSIMVLPGSCAHSVA